MTHEEPKGSPTGMGQHCPLGHGALSSLHSPPASARCCGYAGTCVSTRKRRCRGILVLPHFVSGHMQPDGSTGGDCRPQAVLRLHPCPPTPCSSKTSSKTKMLGVAGVFGPQDAAWDIRALGRSPWMWSLLTPALLPTHHRCARPDWSHHPPLLPLGWQQWGQAASKAPQRSLPSACRCSRDFSCFGLHTSHLQKSTWQLV